MIFKKNCIWIPEDNQYDLNSLPNKKLLPDKKRLPDEKSHRPKTWEGQKVEIEGKNFRKLTVKYQPNRHVVNSLRFWILSPSLSEYCLFNEEGEIVADQSSKEKPIGTINNTDSQGLTTTALDIEVDDFCSSGSEHIFSLQIPESDEVQFVVGPSRWRKSAQVSILKEEVLKTFTVYFAVVYLALFYGGSALNLLSPLGAFWSELIKLVISGLIATGLLSADQTKYFNLFLNQLWKIRRNSRYSLVFLGLIVIMIGDSSPRLYCGYIKDKYQTYLKKFSTDGGRDLKSLVKAWTLLPNRTEPLWLLAAHLNSIQNGVIGGINEFDVRKKKISSFFEKTRLRFKLTEQALENLGGNEVSDSILAKLNPLKNQEFELESKFLQAVEHEIGKDQTAIHKELILKHADITLKNIMENLWSGKPQNCFCSKPPVVGESILFLAEFFVSRYHHGRLNSFRFVKQSFDNLSKAQIPEPILAKLNPLKNQEFEFESKFLEVVEDKIGKDQMVKYKDLILKHARQEYNHTPFQETHQLFGTRFTSKPLSYQDTVMKLKKLVLKSGHSDRLFFKEMLSFNADTHFACFSKGEKFELCLEKLIKAYYGNDNVYNNNKYNIKAQNSNYWFEIRDQLLKTRLINSLDESDEDLKRYSRKTFCEEAGRELEKMHPIYDAYIIDENSNPSDWRPFSERSPRRFFLYRLMKFYGKKIVSESSRKEIKRWVESLEEKCPEFRGRLEKNAREALKNGWISKMEKNTINDVKGLNAHIDGLLKRGWNTSYVYFWNQLLN